ncbi:hypothetical protein V8E53_004234 [Lactarius tabidus]
MLPTVLIWRQRLTQSVPPAVLGIAAGIVSGVVFLPLVAKVVLGWIGFSAIGPVAGSLAALIQAAIGNVAAGSFFAALQSIAMGGLGGVLSAVGGVVGGVLGAIAAFF